MRKGRRILAYAHHSSKAPPRTAVASASMSVASVRSCSSRATTARTAVYRPSMALLDLSGLRNSSPAPRTSARCLQCARRAHNLPQLQRAGHAHRYMVFLAAVGGMLPVDEGCDSTWHSLISAAATICAIIKPDEAGVGRSKRRQPSLMSGLSRRSMRRSVIPARSVSTMPHSRTRKPAARRGSCRRRSRRRRRTPSALWTNTSGLSVADPASTSSTARTC